MGKIYDAIMGLVVGDALGVPFEFKTRDTFHAEGMTGYGTYHQPPGTWSDDSSMTLATMSSMAVKGEVDPEHIMKQFALWLYKGSYTPFGKVFDVGYTTRTAIERFVLGVPIKFCGGREENEKGNGSLMRILPLAFQHKDEPSALNTRQVCFLTHAQYVCKEACDIYVIIAQELAEGRSLDEALEVIRPVYDWPDEWGRLLRLKNIPREEIRSSGYVVDTLEAALWCLYQTGSYRDAVLTAVNLGEDTDTVAAVTGGLAGIMYGTGGEKGIPSEWIEALARREWVEKVIWNFEKEFS